MGDLDALAMEERIAREDDVATVLQGASAGEALQGPAAHNDGVTRGRMHKMAHVPAVRNNHAAVVADAPIIADGNDGGNLAAHSRILPKRRWGCS